MSAASSYDVATLFEGKLALKGTDVPASSLAAKKAGSPFELIFVSSDEDQEGFDEYTKNMPWPSVKFDDEDARSSLGEQFGIKGIPALHIIGKDGKVITTDGRSGISKEKEAAIAKWCAL